MSHLLVIKFIAVNFIFFNSFYIIGMHLSEKHKAFMEKDKTLIPPSL